MKWVAFLCFGLLMLVYIPQIVSADGLPDLIIEGIKIDVGSMPKDIYFAAKVKNIGDASSGSFIELRVRVVWMFLGIIPIKQVYAYTMMNVIGDLDPGETQWLGDLQVQRIPNIRFGSYLFEYTVNPNYLIEESDYFNNDCSDKFFVIFGDWSSFP